MFSVCCTIFTASFFGDGFLERNFLFLLATLCYDNLAQCVYKKVKHMFRNNLICIRRGYYVVCKDSWGPCHSVLLCPFLTSKMKTVKIPHSAPQHNMHIVQDCFVLWGQCLSKIEFNLCTIIRYIVSKCLFWVFNFFKKTNENTSHSIKNESNGSFFGKTHGLTICFRN